MTLASLVLIISLIFLALSAKYFVRHAVRLATCWGMPRMVIGMIVIGLATSMPEIVVATLAAWHQQVDMAVGSIIGSNVANIGLVLGTSAVIAPMPIARRIIRRELIILCLVSFLFVVLCLNGHINRWEGGGLLLLLFGVLLWLCQQGKASAPSRPAANQDTPIQSWPTLILCLLSAALLMASAEALVWSATRIAQHFAVSGLLIGLSVVAVGTSLPELAASISGSLAGENDMVLGNVVGSNLFNLCAALGIPALVHPIAISRMVLHRDAPVLLLATAALYLVSMPFGGRVAKIHRWEGALLLVGYLGYISWVYTT